MITNEGLGTELAWNIYSKLKLMEKMSHMNLIYMNVKMKYLISDHTP